MTALTDRQALRVMTLFVRARWSVGRIARDLLVPTARVEQTLEVHGGPDWRRTPQQLHRAYARLTDRASRPPAGE